MTRSYRKEAESAQEDVRNALQLLSVPNESADAGTVCYDTADMAAVARLLWSALEKLEGLDVS